MKAIQPFSYGIIAGALLGWVAHSSMTGSTPPENKDTASPRTPPDRNPTSSHSPAQKGKNGKPAGSGHFVEWGIEAAAVASRNLSNAEFGEALADLLTGDISLEDRIHAEGMKRQLNPKRFAAFYEAYSKRADLRDSDMTLNNLLIDAGQQFGKTILDTMLQQYPEGFERMDSVLHGWAMGNPGEAVTWFNALPETHSRYDKILQGLVWGLAAKDGPMAGQVIAAMSLPDKEKAMFGFSSSFIEAHGLRAFDAWAQAAPPDLAPEAVRQACEFAARQPPSEYVPWFLTHSGTIGVRGELLQGFDKWFASSAPEAVQWLASLPAESQEIQEILTDRLSNNAKQRFLKDHPDHSGAVLLKSEK